MVEFIFILVVLVVLLLVVGSRLSKLDRRVDDVYHKIFAQEGQLLEHKDRLDAHIKDIASNQKRIDEVDNVLLDYTSKKSINNAYTKDERTKAEMFIIDNYGKNSLRSIAKELNISASTVNRWTKGLKEKGLIK